MNWEGVFIIGSLALAVALLFGIPALILARRVRANPESKSGRKVTKGDLVGTAIVVVVNLVGLTAPFWASDTQFGQWMSTDPGRLTFVAAVFVGWLAIAVLLKIALVLTQRSRSSP
jgi:protein-S-isoprenylcysteine O-methyltransferase Ste14